MFSSAEKTNRTTTAVQQKAQQQTFFRKAGEETFFGAKESSSFFGAPVQAKLSVSSPDDPQEKEADAVADQVMRMPEVSLSPVKENEEKKIDRKEEEEKEILPKIESPTINKISRKEESSIQSSRLLQLHRMAEDHYEAESESGLAGESAETSVYRKRMNHYHSGLIQRSGRGPPGNPHSFGQTLSSSRGGGSPMSSNTLQFMESRFNADFSGVRIHTGSEARQMTSSIHAQAFAHGNDIYFNEGKYSPHTQSGGTLLAHELTHTIQQGASLVTNPASVAPKRIDRKNDLLRSSDKTSELVADCNSRSDTFKTKPYSNFSSSGGSQIHLSQDIEEADFSPESDLNAKPELSNWQVTHFGNLVSNLPPVQKSEEDKDLQKKEDERKEQEDEFVSPKLYSIQKKGIWSGNKTRVYSRQNDSLFTSGNNIQKNQSTANSSLTPHTESPASTFTEVRERGPPVQLKRSGPDMIQRSVLDDALAFTSLGSLLECVDVLDLKATSSCLLRKARDVAMHIPGYAAMRVVLGSDPITGETVERNGRNFIEAAFNIIPGGRLLQQKLDEQHQLDAAAAWIDGKIAAIEHIVSSVFSRFDAFWRGLGITDFGSPMEVMRQGAGIIIGFISDIIDFAIDAGLELLKMVKDFLLDTLVEFIRDRTPVYPLLTVILGEDPITKEVVDRNGTNILNALLALGGEEGQVQRDQLIETGTFDKVAGYIDEGITVFGGLYDTIVQNFHTIWDLISIEALMEPTETFNRIYAIFAEPVIKVLDFISRVVGEMLKLIKEVLFKRISAEAKKVRGYFLVTIIIGKDPFTGEVVPRNAENLIHGFMSLMDGGEEQFQQMKESGAIDRTVGQVNAAVNRLNMTPESIIQLFIDLWNSFSFSDFITPIPTFLRIIDTFGEPIGRLVAFVVEIVRIVVVVILELMNFPFDLIGNIISRTREAFRDIKRDPIGFLKNLLRAIKQGFVQFFDNIVTHLINGVMGWLMSELKDAGIPQLTDFSLQGVISWVLEVLGISMEKIWEKLAAHPRIGPEKVARIKGMINTLEGIWTFIKDVQERGIVAIWEKIQEQLSNLWNTVLDAVKNWVMETIITQVTVKLLGMLDPTGIMAVINSCIAIYNAVQSFIKYMREMLEVLNSFVNGVADIAKGNIATAATYLENTMGRAMPIVIGFLANQVGLGGVGRRVGEMIESVRNMVDNALTWLVNKAVDTGMNLLDRAMAAGRSAVGAILDWWKTKRPVKTKDGEDHTLYLEGSGDNFKLMIKSTPDSYKGFIETNLQKNGLIALPGSPEEKALAKAEEIDKKLENYSKVKQEERVLWGEEVTALIDELVNLTGHLKFNLDVPDPPSAIRWGAPNSDGFGTIMTAEYLSENYVKGEPADKETKAVLGWDYARSFQTISAKGNPTPIYVKGHLLNENLGGPANVVNLTPITNDMNKAHLNTVEIYVKKLVKGKFSANDKDPTPKKVVNYSVDVEYQKHPQRASLVSFYSNTMWQARRDHAMELRKPAPDPKKLAEYKAKDESGMNILALITYEENSLTTGFICSWEQLQFNKTSNKWEPVDGTSKMVPVPHSLPSQIEHYKPVFDTYKTDIK